jgi:6-phosphogluconolactonase (cycloisomerase 2 family)
VTPASPSVAAGLTQQFAAAFPGEMAVDPSGKFLYLLGIGGDIVSVYQVASDGTVTQVNQIAGRDLKEGLLLIGGANPVTWSPNYAYIASSGDEKLTSYTVQTDGSLNSPQSQSTAAAPIAAATLPWGSDLLVAVSSAPPNVTAYAVSNGALSLGSSFGEATQPAGLVMDPSGLMAFEADSSNGNIYEYFYGDIPCIWSNVVGPVFAAQAGAGPVVTDPSGRFLIVANETAESISLFEPEGSAPISPVSLSYTPLAIVMDPTGNYLLVSGDDNELHMLVSNGLGQLTDSSHPLLPGIASSIAVEPTGHFVYAAGSSGLSAFSINSQTQALAPVTLNLPVSLASANGVYIDPSGKFLYVSVSSSNVNALYLFTINGDGTLSSTSAAPVATPNHATSMVFSAQVQ